MYDFCLTVPVIPDSVIYCWNESWMLTKNINGCDSHQKRPCGRHLLRRLLRRSTSTSVRRRCYRYGILYFEGQHNRWSTDNGYASVKATIAYVLHNKRQPDLTSLLMFLFIRPIFNLKPVSKTVDGQLLTCVHPISFQCCYQFLSAFYKLKWNGDRAPHERHLVELHFRSRSTCRQLSGTIDRSTRWMSRISGMIWR